MERNELPQIDAPKFTVNGHILNEYEMRRLQMWINQGRIDYKTINATDEEGNAIVFRSDGFITSEVKGFNISSNDVMALFASQTSRQ